MRVFGVLTAVLLGLGTASPAEARFDDEGARHLCKQAARNQYGARSFDHLTAANRGGGYYKVMGTMHRRGEPDAVLRCRVKDGRITELSIKDEDGSGDNAGAVIGAAIGIAVGAAILGAISDDHSHEDYRGSSGYSGHDSGWDHSYSPDRGITCYTRQRACYRQNGHFAPKWTRREFGQPQGSAQRGGVAEQDMQRFCTGEASAKFHQRPQDIETLPVERRSNGYAVYGQYPPAGRYVTTFTCNFNSSGRFVGVNRR